MLLTFSILSNRGLSQTAPMVQEDFYQPMQEVWNQSDFVPQNGTSAASVPQDPSSTPTYNDPPGSYPGPIRPFAPSSPSAVAAPQNAASPQASQPPSAQNVPSTLVQGPGSAETRITVDSVVEPGGVFADVVTGEGTCRHIFFRYDALYGVLSRPGNTSIGSASAAGIFSSNGISFPFLNSLSSDVFGSPTEFGNRFEFGEIGDECGWMIGIFDWDQNNTANAPGGTLQFNDPIGLLLGYQDSNSDNLDDDLDGDHVYGRDGVDLGTPDPITPGAFLPIYDGMIDAPAPDDADDLVTWVPVFSSLTGTIHTDITGIELLRYWRRIPGAGRLGFDRRFSGGVRFIEFDEDLNVLATGSFFDATSISSSIENTIIGPQIGSEFSRCFGPWTAECNLRFLLGINFQGGKQNGSYATDAASQTGTVNQPLNLSPGAFSNAKHDTAFSPVFEWRLGSAYHLGPHATARVGYTGMLFGGISRAAKSIDYTLPSFGLALRDDAVVFNALTFGFDVVF